MKAVPVPAYCPVMGTFCGTTWPAVIGSPIVEPASEPPRVGDPYGDPREGRGCPSEDEPPGPTRPPTGPPTDPPTDPPKDPPTDPPTGPLPCCKTRFVFKSTSTR